MKQEKFYAFNPDICAKTFLIVGLKVDKLLKIFTGGPLCRSTFIEVMDLSSEKF